MRDARRTRKPRTVGLNFGLIAYCRCVLAPVLVEVWRDGLLESWHRGRLVMLRQDGSIAHALGDCDDSVLPRSSLKPLQSVALVEHGFNGSSAALALATASHDGERRHRDGVTAVLTAVGLSESDLQCPADIPAGVEASREWLAAGNQPSPICHNCSGKHAAMLATSLGAGWPTKSYCDPVHPLQRAIRARVEGLCESEVTAVAVDGCGAPAFGVPLVGLARAFAAIATSRDGAALSVASAMHEHPRLLGGTGRAVTELISSVPGLIAKDGAEGVWAAALPDGRAMAAKLDDGAGRALPPLLSAVLAHWGEDHGPAAAAIRKWAAVPTYGGGLPHGAIAASSELRELLTS